MKPAASDSLVPLSLAKAAAGYSGHLRHDYLNKYAYFDNIFFLTAVYSKSYGACPKVLGCKTT